MLFLFELSNERTCNWCLSQLRWDKLDFPFAVLKKWMCCSLKWSSFEVDMFSLEYHFFKMYVCISSFKLSFISNQKCFAICYFRVNLLFLQILSLPKSNFERTLFRITSEWIPLTESFSKTEPIPIEIASRMHYSHFLIGNPSRLRSKAECAICFSKNAGY
jgi:hypothetical protein